MTGVRKNVRRSRFVLGALMISWPGVAFACTCFGEPPPPKLARDASTAVFMGIVEEIRLARPRPSARAAYLEVRFRVLEDWKGAPFDTIRIGTGFGGGDCGYGFRVGDSYVVYARAWSDSEYAFTSICDRTSSARYALADLMTLGEGTPRNGHTLETPPTRASLIHLLKSRDEGMRASAATALAYCDDEPRGIVNALAVSALSGRNGDRAAAAALGRFGVSGNHRALVEPILKRVLAEARLSAQESALRSLHGLVDAQTFYALVDHALQRGRQDYLYSAVLWAGRPGQPLTVRAHVGRRLLALTRHRDADVRRAALEATRAYPELRTDARNAASRMAREDRDKWVRNSAENYLRSTTPNVESTPHVGR